MVFPGCLRWHLTLVIGWANMALHFPGMFERHCDKKSELR